MIDVQAWQMLIGALVLTAFVRADGLNWISRCCLGYFFAHALATAFWPNWNPGILPPGVSLHVQRNASLTALLILLYLGASRRIDSRDLFHLVSLLIPLDLIHLAVTGRSFLLVWPTFAGGVYACVVPFFLLRGVEYVRVARGRFYLGTCAGILLLVAFSRSATGLVCVGVGSCAYLLARGFTKSLTALLVAFGAAALIARGVHLNPNGRLELWLAAMSWWETNANLYFGIGSGAFEYVGPLIPDSSGTRYGLLHNDYLTVLFNTGFVGMVAYLVLVWQLLKRTFRYPEIFASLCAFCACSMFYFPMHFVWSQILIFGLLLEARRLDANQRDTNKWSARVGKNFSPV